MVVAGGVRLLNLTGYDGDDLAWFIDQGRRAAGVTRRVTVIAESSPIRSRGCATVGGADMVLAVASPSRWSLRRLARLVDHEMLHLTGRQHGDMSDGDLYSLGPVPAWAQGLRIRYRGRAPRQMP